MCVCVCVFVCVCVCVCVNKVISDVYLRPYGAEVNERLVVEMMA